MQLGSFLALLQHVVIGSVSVSVVVTIAICIIIVIAFLFISGIIIIRILQHVVGHICIVIILIIRPVISI